MNFNEKIKIIAISFIVFIGLVSCYNIFKEDEKATFTSFEQISNKNEMEQFLQKNTLREIIENTSLEKDKGPDVTPEKVAYITIDDGPSKFTNELLDILSENDVKATFFLINANMNKYKDEVKRIEKEGNSIGFHSVTHDINELYRSPEATLNEFDTCRNTLEKISGKSSKLIRLPYGSKPYMPKGSYDELVDNKYLIWDWNLDTQDWKSSEDQIVSNVMYYGRERDELVVLIHEKKQSVKALSSIIEILNKRGYTILPITEKDEPKNYWKENLK